MTHKRKLRGIAILITLAFLLSLLPAGMASAASGYEALQVPNVDDDSVDALGTVFAEIRAGALEVGDSVIFRLPADFEFKNGDEKTDPVMNNTDWENNENGTSGNRIVIPAKYGDEDNGLYLAGAVLEYDMLDDNELKVTIDSVTDATYLSSHNCYFYLYLPQIYIDEDFEGDIELVASAPSGSGFPTGKVVVGRVGGGVLDITVIDAPTFSDDTDKATDPVTIRIEEDIKGALGEDDESLKFVLPSGFEWQNPTADDFKLIWGDWDGGAAGEQPPVISCNKDSVGKAVYDLVIYADEDELIIAVNKDGESVKAACFELTLGINVEDETKAKVGDVVAKIRGASDTKQAEVIVGTYGEYDVTIEVDGEPTTVFAGMLEQEIPDIVIKEAVEGSLTNGRTIILTLPSNAKWGAVDDGASDAKVDLDFVGFVGDDGRAIKYKVVGESNDAAELTLEDLEVVLEPGVTGDLVIEVSGTQGLDAELKVAEIVAPVTATASEKTSVKVGLQG
ncbi:MAG TPA: copper amine oxidase, partial [Peptococcaceae bacterium]|nr:copper amine oxidase [Peptococcaceae bacterium]